MWKSRKLADRLGDIENARHVLDGFRDKVKTVCGRELYPATYPSTLPVYKTGTPEDVTVYLKTFGIDG